MTRPSIIRADTIDLQHQEAPSAQDHRHSYYNQLQLDLDPSALANGDAHAINHSRDNSHDDDQHHSTHNHPHPLAPHQAETLREVAHETAEELQRSPGLHASAANGHGSSTAPLTVNNVTLKSQDPNAAVAAAMDAYRQHEQDVVAAAHNGIDSSDDEDFGDDRDLDLDDDLMDKISSSPSIEDGVYTPYAAAVDALAGGCGGSALLPWPRRVSSLQNSPGSRRQAATRHPDMCKCDASPSPSLNQQRLPHHLLRNAPCTSEYRDQDDDESHNSRLGHDDGAIPPPVTSPSNHVGAGFATPNEEQDAYAEDKRHQEVLETIEKLVVSISGDLALDLDLDADSISSDVQAGPAVLGNLVTAPPPPPPPPEPTLQEDDEHDPLSLPTDPDYDDFSSDESLQDSEDIDFEFVYALHTFVATVEGQANATKGDTMVLLDDSNSYWWLVRVVKDSSIGYLPAEHIETPTERLARLNKHRNIDLSATMLGDQAAKQKTTFKNLRKRRKTVAFSEPTYVDYSDIDYSTDEEDIEELFGTQGNQAKARDQSQIEDGADDITPIEPLRTSRDRNGQDTAPDQESAEPTIKAVASSGNEDGVSDLEDDDTSSVEEILHDKADGPSKSRNGTVRNTDSFFNDEETKKITLTPNLLRDDTASRPSTDSAAKDSIKGRSSLENKMERELVPDKDKRKSKDKKPSAIRSFFSRKDKKKADDDDESFGKRSMDIISDPRDSEEHPEGAVSPPDKPSRTPSKLQKQQPRAEPSPSNRAAAAQRSTAELSSFLNASRNDVASVPPASMRVVDPETQETHEIPSGQQPAAREAQNRSASANTQHTDKSGLSKMMPRRSASTGADAKPQKTVKARTRMELDESDLSELEEDDTEPARAPALDVQDQTAPKPEARTATPQDAQAASESAQVSPSNASNPPALVPDTSSAEARSPEASPSPELAQAKDSGSAASSNREQWDDGKLRAFFDEGEHIRDLLAVVYDKSDAPTVDNDHPYTGSLFREQNAKLAEITTQLDNLLGDWLARKQRLRGTS